MFVLTDCPVSGNSLGGVRVVRQSKAKSVDSRPLDLVVSAIARALGVSAVRKVRSPEPLVHAGTAPAPTDSPRSGRGPSRPYDGIRVSPLRASELAPLPLASPVSGAGVSSEVRSGASAQHKG